MKETTQKNDTTTEYAQDTSLQAGHGKPGGTKEQAKEVLDKAAEGVEEAYAKTVEKVGEVYEKVAPAAQQAYDKTAHAVNETYQHSRQYSLDNPGKSLLIALGIGVGIGYILGQNAHYPRGSRYARPIVNAVSDVAMEFFR